MKKSTLFAMFFIVVGVSAISYGAFHVGLETAPEFYPTPPPVDSSIAIHVYVNKDGKYSVGQALSLRTHYGLPVIVLPYSERPDRLIYYGDTLKVLDKGGLLSKYGALDEILMFVANDEDGSLKQWETTTHYYNRSKKGDPLRHTGWDDWEHGDLNRK